MYHNLPDVACQIVLACEKVEYFEEISLELFFTETTYKHTNGVY